MKGATFIGGGTLILVACAILGYFTSVPEKCGAQAAIAFPIFDPFRSGGSVAVQEPWLDPLVFFSNYAYVVSAVRSGADEEITDASFVGGNDGLVRYLKEGIAPHVAPGIGWLKPPMVLFTIDQNGEATGVELKQTSGNAELDARLIRVIEDMPSWTPAKDAQGRAMHQPFEFRVIQGGCDQNPSTAPTRKVSLYNVPILDREVAMNHPYDIDFDLEKVGEDQYRLITNMKLHGGSFYVSPYSTNDFKGKFRIEIANDDHMVMEDAFTEKPRSREEIDLHQFVNGPVNWVSEDTRYEHTFTVRSTVDFAVGGKYQFTIEPRCTMEIVPFLIKNRSGVLSIEKAGC